MPSTSLWVALLVLLALLAPSQAEAAEIPSNLGRPALAPLAPLPPVNPQDPPAGGEPGETGSPEGSERSENTEKSEHAGGDGAQADADTDDDDDRLHLIGEDGLIEELTYLQQPGLPPAASKIYFSERRYALSGFGEIAFNHRFGERNRASGDLELYYSNLYRFVFYGAFRFTKWMVGYAEIFAEVYHDGLNEVGFEAFPEVFIDFVIAKPFNIRVGWAQVPIGYINNNDEPIMFHSVDRPDVERLIVPSQWIELGIHMYGKLGRRGSWLVSGFQGLRGEDLMGASWIRQGRHLRFDFASPGVAAQINYTPVDALDLSVSGAYVESGGRRSLVDASGETRAVRAPTALATAYARYERRNWSLLALGSMGWMGDTAGLYGLTGAQEQGPQVLGARTYGYYLELACDLVPYLWRGKTPEGRPNLLYRPHEFRLPVFARYERLDTHARIDPELASTLTDNDRIYRSNLDIVTAGININTRRNLVFKVNYQLRHNRARAGYIPREGHGIGAGMGFIF